jgi:hypothetical protein
MSKFVEPQIDERRLLVVEVAGAGIVRSSNLGAALAGYFRISAPFHLPVQNCWHGDTDTPLGATVLALARTGIGFGN